MIILGIDPGTNVMGYGLIRKQNNALEYLNMGVLNLKKEEDPLVKLGKIHECIESLILEYKPDVMAIEAPFFGKNPQSLIKLGRAQGVAISVAIRNNIEVFEYAPLRIKQCITGNGQASKDAVCRMIFKLLHIDESVQVDFFDASDALAAAVCHSLHSNIIDIKKNAAASSTLASKTAHSPKAALKKSANKKTKSKKTNSWTQFILSNPDKVV